MSESEDDEQPELVFKRDGASIRFVLSEFLTLGQQQELRNKIVRHGGEVLDEDHANEADTYIVEEEHMWKPQSKYRDSKTLWIEQPQFVQRCIDRKKYEHIKPLQRNMGGVASGSARTRRAFSDAEDWHLARYLANRIPHKENGGRTGNGVYKELMATDYNGTPLYPWSQNHTWHSWRERYKKHPVYFDEKINEILKYEPPHPDGKGEYHLKRFRPNHFLENEEEEKEEEEEKGSDTDGETPTVVPGKKTVKRTNTENVARRNHQSKRTRLEGQDIASPEHGRHGQRRRTPEGQVAGPSRSQDAIRFDKQPQFDSEPFDLDDAMYHMPVQDQDPEPLDIPMNTQATLVEPLKATKGKSVQNPPHARRVPSSQTARVGGSSNGNFRVASGTAKPPVDTQATVVPTQAPEQTATSPNGTDKPHASASAVMVEPLGGTSIGIASLNDNAVVSSTPVDRPVIKPRAARKSTLFSAPRRSPSEISQTTQREVEVPVPLSSTTRSKLASNEATTEAQPKPKGRRKAQEVHGPDRREDAPYRNTRARSKSVDPVPLLPPSRGVKPRSAMKVVEEEDDEEEAQIKDTDVDSTIPADDELSVENKLLSVMDEEEDEESPGSSSDDEGSKTIEMARMLLMSRSLRSSSTSPVIGRAIRLAPSPTSIITTSFNHQQQGLTPDDLFIVSGRYEGLTSGDDFPTPDTKAYAEKQRRLLEQKKRPYNPPRGTKAAVHIASTTRQNKGKQRAV